MEEVLDHLEEEGDGPLHLEGEGVAIKPDSDDEESLEEVLDEESKVGSNTCLALQGQGTLDGAVVSVVNIDNEVNDLFFVTVNTKPVMATSIFNQLSYQDDVARLSLDIESTKMRTDIKL